MRLFIRTPPKGCPDNLAIRGEDDLALVSQSLHAWKADLLRRERQVMHASGGDWSEEEVRWATCMKLSRAFAGTGSGPVMMPLMDLFNHNHTRGDCRESGRWVDESAGRWDASIVAERDLPEGTELVYPYSESPSKARLLTSFGFTEGAASATLAATQLPERDASFMAAQGCHGKGAPRTDLDLEPGATVIGQANLRDAVRCIRLALYTPEEASWALKSGHLDGPWGGVVTAHNRAIALGSKAEEDILASVLEKDHRVAVNTGRMCEAAHTEEQHEAQRARCQLPHPIFKQRFRKRRLHYSRAPPAFEWPSRSYMHVESTYLASFGPAQPRLRQIRPSALRQPAFTFSGPLDSAHGDHGIGDTDRDARCVAVAAWPCESVPPARTGGLVTGYAIRPGRGVTSIG